MLIALDTEEMELLFTFLKYASTKGLVCGNKYLYLAERLAQRLLNQDGREDDTSPSLACKTPGCKRGEHGYLENGYCRDCAKRPMENLTTLEQIDRRICDLEADVHVLKRQMGEMEGDDD